MLADDSGSDAGDAAEFDLDAVVCCFAVNVSDGDLVFALRCHDDMDEPRFSGGRHHGETGWRSGGVEVQQKRKRKAVADVRGKIEVVSRRFPIFVARRDLTAGGIDEHIEGYGKRGSALDVMVADEAKDFALRKDRGLLIERAVAKVKGKARRDALAVGDLNKIADGEGAALRRLEHQEAMERALRIADGNGVGDNRFGRQKGHRKEQEPARTRKGED